MYILHGDPEYISYKEHNRIYNTSCVYINHKQILDIDVNFYDLFIISTQGVYNVRCTVDLIVCLILNRFGNQMWDFYITYSSTSAWSIPTPHVEFVQIRTFTQDIIQI